MTVKPLVFGALAAACVTAAAGGAYVAVRQNPSAAPAPVSEQTAGPASSGASSPAAGDRNRRRRDPAGRGSRRRCGVRGSRPRRRRRRQLQSAPRRRRRRPVRSRRAPVSKSVDARPNPAPAAPHAMTQR